MSQRSAAPRIQFMNYLNIFACFAVICLHCSQAVFHPEASMTWGFSVIMQSVFIFAVPIFFMISGANLLAYRRRYSTKTFFKKRFRKTFVALLIGSILVYCITCFCPALFNRIPRIFSATDFLALFVSNGIEAIYWFFYVILALYIITPILSPLAESKSILSYAIIVLAVITSILPMLSRYIPSFGFVQSLFGAQAFTGAIMFFLLGYYLQNCMRGGVWRNSTYVSIWVLCTILMVASTFIINIDAVQNPGIPYEGFFANAFSIFGLGSSVSVFMIFKRLESRFQKASPSIMKIVQRLSSASLGVYLIHLLVMDNIAFWAPHPWSLTMTVEPFVVYVAAVVIVIATQTLWNFAKRTAIRGIGGTV